MKKNELQNGDLVVMRRGGIGVVIDNGEESLLLYVSGGFEVLDDYYDDDMVDDADDDAVMQVFRPEGRFGFEGIDEEMPIYERDPAWTRPISEGEAKIREIARAREEERAAQWRAQAEENRKNLITIITQAYYGNRTATEIRRDEMDRFILGYQSSSLPVEEPIDRTILHLPGSDELVLIYNRFAEEKRLEDKEVYFKEYGCTLTPLATLPEMGLELYSRCIVCRMTAEGRFESVMEDDYEIWGRYLAK